MKIFSPSQIAKSADMNGNFASISNAIKIYQNLKRHNITDSDQGNYFNGWADYDTWWRIPSFYRDSSGLVHIEGLMKGGINSYAFEIPPEYCPADLRPLMFSTVAAYGGVHRRARLDLNMFTDVDTGKIFAMLAVADQGSLYDWVSVSGIHYLGEQ